MCTKRSNDWCLQWKSKPKMCTLIVGVVGHGKKRVFGILLSNIYAIWMYVLVCHGTLVYNAKDKREYWSEKFLDEHSLPTKMIWDAKFEEQFSMMATITSLQYRCDINLLNGYAKEEVGCQGRGNWCNPLHQNTWWPI